jgi:fluoroacetyl-CoA thioesterase
MEVIISVRLVAVEGRKLSFEIEARDERDVISTGKHERFVIDAEKFNARLAPRVRA